MKRETAEGKLIKQLRDQTGLSQQKFGALFRIPSMNIANWEQGTTKPPEYVITMIQRLMEIDPRIPKIYENIDM